MKEIQRPDSTRKHVLHAIYILATSLCTRMSTKTTRRSSDTLFAEIIRTQGRREDVAPPAHLTTNLSAKKSAKAKARTKIQKGDSTTWQHKKNVFFTAVCILATSLCMHISSRNNQGNDQDLVIRYESVRKQ